MKKPYIKLGNHYLVFKYHDEKLTIPLNDIHAKIITQECITCELYNKDLNLKATSTVRRHFTDRPNKTVGRHFAFKKVMQVSSNIVSRDDKTLIWDDYRIKLRSPIRLIDFNDLKNEDKVSNLEKDYAEAS